MFFYSNCPLCQDKKFFWKSLCRECTMMFELVHQNLGKMGLGQLIDVLLATGVAKSKVKLFLEADPLGKGSMMDQIVAMLTNNLAEGIGVKGADMKPSDVKKIRSNPVFGASTKKIEN